jgi:hypothetical protein
VTVEAACRECARSDQRGGDRKRADEVDVGHEEGAEQGAREHRRDRYEATGGITSVSAGEPGVGSNPGERQGQDGGREVGTAR